MLTLESPQLNHEAWKSQNNIVKSAKSDLKIRLCVKHGAWRTLDLFGFTEVSMLTSSLAASVAGAASAGPAAASSASARPA